MSGKGGGSTSLWPKVDKKMRTHFLTFKYYYAMSIVTKTGDKGETGLIGGQRVPKSDLRIEAIGTIDELSAQLGFVQRPEIQRIQIDLYELGALLADPQSQKNPEKNMNAALKRIEEELRTIEKKLPPLKNFILPGGDTEAAHLHFARAICRRAERAVCRLAPIPYLNRLSDYLFLLARQINHEKGTHETIISLLQQDQQ